MAGGSFDFPISGKNSSGTYIQGRLEWTGSVISGQNASTLSITIKARKANDIYTLDIPTGGGDDGAWSYAGTVNGDSISGSYDNGILTSFVTIGTVTKTVTHGADGTKVVPFTCTVTAPPGSGLAGLTSTGTTSLTLDTITPSAEKSTLTAYSGTLGTAQQVSINQKTSGVTHRLFFDTGLSTEEITVSDTSFSWTPSLSYAADSPNSKTLSCQLILYTYKDGTQLGSDTRAVTMTVPENSSTKPALTISTARVDAVTLSGVQYLLTGKSKVRVTASASGKYGAAISSYQFVIAGKTYTQSSNVLTSDVLDKAGTLDITVTAADSRGISKSVESSLYTVYDYAAPAIVKLSGEAGIILARCDSSGTVSESGTYLLVKAARQYSSVNGANKCALKLQYKISSASAYSEVTLLGENDSGNTYSGVVSGVTLAAESSYDLRLSETDSVGTTVTYSAAIGTESVPLHLAQNGKRVAIGGYATAGNTNLLEVKWPMACEEEAEFDDTVTVTGALTAGSVTTAGTVSAASVTTTGDCTVGGDEEITGDLAVWGDFSAANVKETVSNRTAQSGWEVRQWSSGRKECWITLEKSSVSVSQSSVNTAFYTTTEDAWRVAYPSGFFSSAPHVQITMEGGSPVFPIVTAAGSANYTPYFKPMSHMAWSGRTVKIYIHAIGS